MRDVELNKKQSLIFEKLAVYQRAAGLLPFTDNNLLTLNNL